MPIRPENRARYPKDWKLISARIRFERAGGRCECTGQCGLDHEGRCDAWHGDEHPQTGSKVVLTVMHMDHQPENNDEANLMAGCQRCHNRYDAPMRRAGIKKRAFAAIPVNDLFATLRADLAKAVEGLEGALGGLGCRSDCEWLHPDGSKCDCGNRERKLIAQSLIKELRP